MASGGGAPAVRPSTRRRLLDVVVAGLGLVVSAPVLGVAALLVRAGSPGPVLFRQERMGAGEQPFTILKLRTMDVGAAGPGITVGNDPRVTRVGGLLRRTSIDELPQLVNILRGEMTLVGPRPETVSLAERYPASTRWVLQHTPGLTGPAQVRLRDSTLACTLSLVPRGAAPEELATLTERWYLEEVVPSRVALDEEFLADPSLRRTFGVLAQTAVYLLRSIRGGQPAR
ncbi:MAG TPA: sugar transferase [Humibacillus xanthopallidus]|nr:sugar transferase [Humibacillus xanthopallidus]